MFHFISSAASRRLSLRTSLRQSLFSSSFYSTVGHGTTTTIRRDLLLRRGYSTITRRATFGIFIGGSIGLLTYPFVSADTQELKQFIQHMVPDAELYAQTDIRLPFRDRSTWSVFRSWLVFNVCEWSWLIEWAPTILELANTYYTTSIVNFFLRHTFFAHFCGGESIPQLTNVISSLQAQGIGAILDISIESDIHHHYDSTLDPMTLRQVQESNADYVATLFSQAIDAASLSDNACIAVKLTALTPTPVLISVTKSLMQLEKLFHDSALNAPSNRMNREKWLRIMPEGGLIFDTIMSIKDKWTHTCRETNQITYNDIIALLIHDPNPNYFTLLGVPITDVTSFIKLMNRLHKLCEQAKRVNVPIMVDAEQTYFQPAIDIATLALSKQYNQNNCPILFHTYQLYLKDTLYRLQRDLTISELQNWHFAAKLVRGAYMISERSKAKLEGYPSPVHNTIDDTHRAYHTSVDTILTRIANSKSTTNTSATCMIATHNRQSIVRTLNTMNKMSIDKKAGHVMFGQLLGMHDLTSYALAHNGYPIYKYLPYGPVPEVIPYLLRRAQENNAVLANGSVDKMILWHELVCRFQGVVS